MKKSEMFGFSLEVDDRSEEDRRREKKPAVASLLGLDQEEPNAIMDTDFDEKMEPPKRMIRVKADFAK